MGRSFVAMLLVAALAVACGGAASPPAAPSASIAAPAATEPGPIATAPATIAPAAGAAGLAPTGPTEAARVVRVVDGDTIVVDRGRGSEKLRYIGMDTPETVKPGSPVEWMGPEASNANRALVEGQSVVLEKDVSETDQYGRLLRDVWLQTAVGWRLVDLELVRQGYARVSTYPPDVKYVDLLLAAQADARDHDRGLWGSGPLDFLSPADGATVSTGTIAVRGRAAAGSRIVRDIANAPDQSTRAGPDGTWSMQVGLKKGVNTLHFRVGDEKATTRTLVVTFAP